MNASRIALAYTSRVLVDTRQKLVNASQITLAYTSRSPVDKRNKLVNARQKLVNASRISLAYTTPVKNPSEELRGYPRKTYKGARSSY